MGWNGRAVKVKLADTVIAAIQSRGATFNREAVDITSDDDSGWRKLLPEPGVRSLDANIEGVATEGNFNTLLSEWNGNVFSDITLEYPDGTTVTAADGFFLGSLELSGESGGHVAFTATFQSSGAVAVTPPAG